MNWGENPYNLQRVTTKQPLKHKNVKIKQYQYIKGNILRTSELGRTLNRKSCKFELEHKCPQNGNSKK